MVRMSENKPVAPPATTTATPTAPALAPSSSATAVDPLASANADLAAVATWILAATDEAARKIRFKRALRNVLSETDSESAWYAHGGDIGALTDYLQSTFVTNVASVARIKSNMNAPPDSVAINMGFEPAKPVQQHRNFWDSWFGRRLHALDGFDHRRPDFYSQGSVVLLVVGASADDKTAQPPLQ
jgi:hypothetical protein